MRNRECEGVQIGFACGLTFGAGMCIWLYQVTPTAANETVGSIGLVGAVIGLVGWITFAWASFKEGE